MATTTKTKPRSRSQGPIEARMAARRPATPASGGSKSTRSNNSKAKNLVIVESPTKARTVGGILGDDYRVIASVGHVRDLPPYGYGVVDIDNADFTPKYVVVKDKKRGVDKTDVISDIAEAAKNAERVFLSTDPDREGEAIAWHIREAAGIPESKTTRVVFHEITKPAIERAFQEALNPGVGSDEHGRHGKLDMDLVDAQQARRVLDRLIGFPLTWFVQGKVSKSASAGRVQSVALRLIVERERLIQDFKPTEYWTISARLAKQASRFTAELARLPGERGKTSIKPGTGEFRPSIPNEEAANNLVAAFNRSEFAVSSMKKGSRKSSPVPPFTTSTFQQAAVNRLNMPASRAMSIAQQLYEGIDGEGLITYMRTDSLNIAPGARADAREYIRGRWGAEFVPAKERVYRTGTKGAQEAHEAIRPTSAARSPEALRGRLNAEQMRVYTLIWQRFVASQMEDARFDTVKVEIEAKEAGTLRGTFTAGAQHLRFAGHLAVYGKDANDPVADEEDDTEASLPELLEGEALVREGIDPSQHATQPPPRFTEASLVKALEEQGIGRPSTYATIVQTVQKRDYVTKEGRALVPQELGFLVNDLLVQHLEAYVAVPFTGEMEGELDEVAEGKKTYQSVITEFWPAFKLKLDGAKEDADKVGQTATDIRCNVCDQANLVLKWGRNGKFFACPRYPECSNSLPMGANGEPVFVEPAKETSYACPRCGSTTIQKSGPYGPYIDCIQRETKKCDFRAGVPVGVPCPEEPDTGQLVEKTARSGKRGVFYACWNYPNCSYTSNTLEPGKMPPARPLPEREEANKKLLERSARGKAAFAKRRTNAVAKKAS